MSRKKNQIDSDAVIDNLNPEQLPLHLIERQESRMETVDFDSVKRKLIRLTQSIDRIHVPSQEAWEAMLVKRSLNVPFKEEQLYWAYHAYYGSERFRGNINAYNKAVDVSGLLELAQGMTPKKGSAASFVLRAIDTGQSGSALLDFWFYLGRLLGRRIELLGADMDQRRFYQMNLKAGAPAASIGQHVWYARWLVKNCRDFKRDRANAEYQLAKVCKDLVDQRRILHGPNGAPPLWKREWYRKLLTPGRHPRSSAEPELSDRLTRMTKGQVDRLARHKYITADLLPPLRAVDFPPVTSNHP